MDFPGHNPPPVSKLLRIGANLEFGPAPENFTTKRRLNDSDNLLHRPVEYKAGSRRVYLLAIMVDDCAFVQSRC